MNLKHLWALLLVVVTLLLQTGSAIALSVPPVPTDIPIVDQTNTLTTEQKANLAALIAEERAKTTNQIALLMIPSLQGDSLEEYSIRVAREWGIGEKDKDNGVLLLIAKDERRLRIEVGYGLEGALTDARSSQIIRDRITPEFRQERYYEGIDSGLRGIIAAIHNEFDPALQPEANRSKSWNWEEALFFLLFIPVWISSILARTKSWWAGGIFGAIIGIILGLLFGFVVIGILSILLLTPLGLLFDWAVSRNYRQRVASGDHPSWWAGGTHLGGGGSSSGFGGFGGGSFGGGGSSGSW